MKKLIFLLVLLTTASYGADYHSPYDPGAARNTLSNVTPATGRAALGLGTISTKADTDYVATSALALRLDTGNASFTGDIDVTGDVGAGSLHIYNATATNSLRTASVIMTASSTVTLDTLFDELSFELGQLTVVDTGAKLGGFAVIHLAHTASATIVTDAKSAFGTTPDEGGKLINIYATSGNHTIQNVSGTRCLFLTYIGDDS